MTNIIAIPLRKSKYDTLCFIIQTILENSDVYSDTLVLSGKSSVSVQF